LFDILGIRDLLPDPGLVELLGTKACAVPDIKELCANVMFLITGFDEKNLNLVLHICSIFKYLLCNC